MAASGFTPIALYSSTTATNVPLAANLANGELAINITDGNLFYKDNSGVVQTIANKNATAGLFTGTGQVLLPVGSTAQRSAVPIAGYIRYNSTLNQFEGYTNTAGKTISSITYVTTTATLTTATAHELTTGTVVIVSGATPAAYNGTYTITVTSTTQFTYTMAANPGANASVVGSYVSGAWGSIGSGGGGGGGLVANGGMFENTKTITVSYTITTGSCAMSTGPITVTSGHTITVPSGSRWVIL